jgi:hypothetical protein
MVRSLKLKCELLSNIESIIYEFHKIVTTFLKSSLISIHTLTGACLFCRFYFWPSGKEDFVIHTLIQWSSLYCTAFMFNMFLKSTMYMRLQDRPGGVSVDIWRFLWSKGPAGNPGPVRGTTQHQSFWGWWPVCLWQVTEKLWNCRQDIYSTHMNSDWLELNGWKRARCLKKQMYAALPSPQTWPRLK